MTPKLHKDQLPPDPTSPEFQANHVPISREQERIINRGNGLRISKRQKLFCQTFAVTQAKNTLMKKRFVFLVGKSGDGKTATAYHILEDLVSEDESLHPFIVQEPEDLDNLDPYSGGCYSGRHYVVLVDDIFGTSSVSASNIFQKWKKCYLPLLETRVNDRVVYFIATSLNIILSKLNLKGIQLLSNVIDTTTDAFSLRAYEKKPMLTEYLEKHKIDMSDEVIDIAVKAELPIGFPQCCSYYVSNSDARAVGPRFFQKPLSYLQDKISTLKLENNLAYLVLVMAIFEKGRLAFENLDAFNSTPLPYMKELKQACGVPMHATMEEIKQAAEDVCKIGYFISSDTEQVYLFPHQSVYDAVCFIFGKHSVQKVIEICPLDFLLDHTALQLPEKKTSQSVFQIKGNVKDCFINRLITEIKNGNPKVLEHSSFNNVDFVEEVKKDKRFLSACREMFSLTATIDHLISSRTLYFLTAARTDSPFSSLLVETVGELNVHRKQRLLHDILEGACSSGDLALFSKVISLGSKPCENCFLLAAESQIDQPHIMKALPQETFTENQRKILKTLVKQGRVETLRCVQESVNWHSFQTQKRRQKLFNTVCIKGDFEMFDFLAKNVLLPDCTNELLVSAIIGKNKNIVKKLLTEENKNFKDKLGRTPLHHACYHAPKLCKLLAGRGVGLDTLDNRGATPFHMACLSMNEKIMDELLTLGLKVTITGLQDGNHLKLSPLHMAAQNEMGWKLVGALIEKGPYDGIKMVNFPDGNDSTPLHIASGRPNREKMIKALLKKGANHMLKDKHGKTALHIASEANLPQNIECLITKFKDVNIRDREQRTPLHLAVTREDLSRDEKDTLADSVNHLLQKKADIDLSDSNGNTPVHVAGLHNSPYRIFEILIPESQKKVILNQKNESPLHVLLSPKLAVDTLKLLLGKYPKRILKIKTSDERSVLHVALDRQVPYNIIRTLIENESYSRSTNWMMINFFTSFKNFSADQIVHFLKAFASYFPAPVRDKVIKLLCSREMPDDKWMQGMKLLTSENVSLSDPALVHGVADSFEKVKYLIEKGISVDAKNFKYKPLLHSLISQGNVKGIQFILENYKVDLTAADSYKQTALLKTVKQAVTDSFVEVQDYHNQSGKSLSLYDDLLPVVLSYFGQFRETLTRSASSSISLMVRSSSNLNISDEYGNSAIHYAVLDLVILKKLVSAGANLHKRGGKGQTCLHVACAKKSNTDVLEYLLDNGVLPSVQDMHGMMPLHIALVSKMKNLSLLRRLYHPQMKELTKCPFLHLAAYFSTAEVVNFFIESNQCDLFTADTDGYLPIHCAVAGGDIDVVKQVTEAMKTATDTHKSFQGQCTGDLFPEKENKNHPMRLLSQSLVHQNEFSGWMTQQTEKEDSPAGTDNLSEWSGWPSTADQFIDDGDLNTWTALQSTETGDTWYPDEQTSSGDMAEHVGSLKTKDKPPVGKDHLTIKEDQHIGSENQSAKRSARSGDQPTRGRPAEDKSPSSEIWDPSKETEDSQTVRRNWSIGNGRKSADIGSETLDMSVSMENEGSVDLCKTENSEKHRLTSVSSLLKEFDVCSEPSTQQSLKQVMETWKGRNILCFAALYNNVNIISFLLKEGFLINETDRNGDSPLHIAVKCNSGIETASDHDHSGCAELHICLEKGRIQIIEHLLKSHAPLDVFNNDGQTPFHIACTDSFPFVKIMKVLEYGVSAISCSPKDGKNPLHLICSNTYLSVWFSVRNSVKRICKLDGPVFDSIRIPKILIEKGCSVNARDAEGQTPLHLAAAAGNAVFVNILIENKADIEAVDNQGRTPLHRALEEREISSIPNISLRPHLAALRLVEKGARLHAVVRNGEIPCDMLVKLQQKEPECKEVQHMCELFNIKTVVMYDRGHSTEREDWVNGNSGVVMESSDQANESGHQTEGGQQTTENGNQEAESGHLATEFGEHSTENGEHSSQSGPQKTETGGHSTESGNLTTESVMKNIL